MSKAGEQCNGRDGEAQERRRTLAGVAWLALFFEVVSFFGYLDFAPTTIFAKSGRKYVNTTEIARNATFTSNLVRTQPAAAERQNLDIFLPPNHSNVFELGSFPSLLCLLLLTGIVALVAHFAYESDIGRWRSIGISFFIYAVGLGGLVLLYWTLKIAVGLGYHDGRVPVMTVLGFGVHTASFWLILLFALGEPNPIDEAKQSIESVVNLYSNKVARVAQGILTIGITLTIGGAVSYGIGSTDTTIMTHLLLLSGVFLAPTFGIVVLLYLRLHWIEKDYRQKTAKDSNLPAE